MQINYNLCSDGTLKFQNNNNIIKNNLLIHHHSYGSEDNVAFKISNGVFRLLKHILSLVHF